MLAAGASSRFGGDKLLAVVGDKPIARHAFQGLAAGVRDGPIVVVARPDAAALKAALAGWEYCVWAENPDADSGMASSLQAGLAALPADCDAAFIALADMPLVSVQTYKALASALRPGDYAAIPVYQGRRGNPVLLARALFSSVSRLSGDVGAKALLAAHAERVRDVMVDDRGICADVDTRSDLASVLKANIVGGE